MKTYYTTLAVTSHKLHKRIKVVFIIKFNGYEAYIDEHIDVEDGLIPETIPHLYNQVLGNWYDSGIYEGRPLNPDIWIEQSKA